MRCVWGWPGFGWKMYGVIGARQRWFFGLSRNIMPQPEASPAE